MVWELGEEGPQRENSQGKGMSISVGSRKNEHTINCSPGKSTVVMCQIQFNIFFLCMCKLLYSSVDVRFGSSYLECKGWRNKCHVYCLLLMPASKGRLEVVN